MLPHGFLDQFQSLALIQGLRSELRSRNIGEVRVYEKVATAAVNWKRWETFKTALYRGLVHAPHDTDSAKWSALEELVLAELPALEESMLAELLV